MMSAFTFFFFFNRNNNNASLKPGPVSRNSGMIVAGVNLVFIRGK